MPYLKAAIVGKNTKKSNNNEVQLYPSRSSDENYLIINSKLGKCRRGSARA